MRETKEFQERIKRIDGLVQQLESAGDPAMRATAKELVQSLMDLHGAAIERVLQIVSQSEEAGPAMLQSLSSDGLVSSLLVLYELHPDGVETRVRRGLEKARQALSSRGGAAELLSVGDGIVHVRMKVSGGHGCGSTVNEVRAMITDAVYEAAPDAVDLVIEAEPEPATASGFVPLASLRSAPAPVAS